jgi:hypothetical protein
MDADLKVLKYYIELALREANVYVTSDMRAELDDAIASLSRRLTHLEDTVGREK